MAFEFQFLLPDLGEGLVEATVTKWLVAVGDTVTLNQPLVEVETAKLTAELPSPAAGQVTALHAELGTVLAVGEPLVTLETEAPVAASVEEPAPVAAAAAEAPKPRRERSAKVVARPAVRRLANELGVDISSIASGSGPGGEVTADDVQAAAASG
jgi:2-oxoisovalerate dehydrogenase E2 component (dihydrolipoyl transacylase)